MTQRNEFGPRGMTYGGGRGVTGSLLARVGAGCVMACVLASSPVASAQTGGGQARAAEDAKRANQKALSDFAHYMRIAQYDMAKGTWTELQGKGMSDVEFVELVESGDVARFEDAVQRAMRAPGEMATVGAEMFRMYESGKLARARSEQEIAKNIAALTGPMRGRLLAVERLRSAGEYAMPQLLEAFLNGNNAQRQAESQRVIIGMGRHAVSPLCAALMSVTPAQQERIADLLGLIGYRGGLPYLSDLAGTTQSPGVKSACERAIGLIGGTAGTTSQMYAMLAEDYYAEKPEVVNFPGEEFQLLWDYDPRIGLVMTAIRTPVFHEARAMALAERALTLEAGEGGANPNTVALWVASNFSREIDTPANYVNPAYPVAGAVGPGQTARRSAEYFAVASGADVSQRVLARALDTRDTPLSRRAVSAVEQTAGVKALVSTEGMRMPLVEALNYPNRRVQYEAALAIAASHPSAGFPGAERVVPTLGATIRGASQQFAAVLADNAETYQGIRAVLQGMGYTVLAPGRSVDDLATGIAESPAVDVVVTAGQNAEHVVAAVEALRGTPKTSATPVVILATADSYFEVRNRYEGMNQIAVRRQGVSAEAVRSTVQEVVMKASGGPITADEASAYSRRGLAALRDLAISGGEVLNVADAAEPLMAALPGSSGETRTQIAEVLSRVNLPKAQRSLMDAALALGGRDRVAMLGHVSQSAKRHGNLLEPRHSARLLEIASSGADDEATAAASLMGALNVSNSDVLPLILRTSR